MDMVALTGTYDCGLTFVPMLPMYILYVGDEKEMKNKKIDSLQALRMLACVGVTISHIGMPELSPLGHWGVSIFFVLSGFLMAYSDKNEIGRLSVCMQVKYAYKRIAKLYPIHILMMLAMVVLWFIGNRSEWIGESWPINRIIVNSLLLQDWLPTDPEINAPTWFLSALLLCYICYPNFNLAKDKMEYKKDLIFLLIAYALIQSCFMQCVGNGISDENYMFLSWFLYKNPIMRLFDFFIGCNLFGLYKYNYNISQLILCLLVIFGITYGCFFCKIWRVV